MEKLKEWLKKYRITLILCVLFPLWPILANLDVFIDIRFYFAIAMCVHLVVGSVAWLVERDGIALFLASLFKCVKVVSIVCVVILAIWFISMIYDIAENVVVDKWAAMEIRKDSIKFEKAIKDSLKKIAEDSLNNGG
ncbi:MAG: hypothetical protein FWF63_00400 [Fibromonadales bacterium]|nr:hypothetical protein [Fibromonadales bacterium]